MYSYINNTPVVSFGYDVIVMNMFYSIVVVSTLTLYQYVVIIYYIETKHNNFFDEVT